MAESDDDEGFGDFKFASSSNSINGPGHFSANNISNTDDDDWGDFINSSSHSRAGSLPAELFDPFGISSPQAQPNSVPSGSDSAPTGWIKPSGALPLSIFGEEEGEEEESGAADPPFNGANGLFFSPRKVDNAKTNQSDLNDLIFNLYKHSVKNNDGNGPKSSVLDPKNSVDLDTNNKTLNQNEHDECLHGSTLNLNGKHELNFSSTGSISKQDELNWGSNGLNSNVNSSSLDGNGTNLRTNLFKELNLSSKGLAPMQNGFKLDLNGFDSSLVHGDVKVDGDDGGDDDDDGWEFMSADSKAKSETEMSNVKREENKAQNGSISNFNASNFSWNVLGEDNSRLNSNVNGVHLSSAGENEESSDDDGWEFKAAESEMSSRNDSTKVDGEVQEHQKGAEYIFGFGNGTNGPSEFFVTQAGVSGTPYDWGFRSSFGSSSKGQSMQDNKNNGFISSAVDDNIDSDKSCWAFKDGFLETRSEDKEEPKVANGSAVEDFSFDGKIQRNEGRLEKHKRALPLSIFGDIEPETDDPLTYHDVSTNRPASSKVGMKNPGSNMPIKDLISTLYSQAEQNASINHRDGPNENKFGSTQREVAPDLIQADDGFDDDSWEFKGALSGSGVKNHRSVLGVGDSFKWSLTKGEMNDYVDFYLKLKDELCFVALSHVDSLKSSAPAGGDAEIEGLEKEIQDLCDVTHKDGTITKRIPSEHNPSRSVFLNEFCKILQEEKFQVLELEYHLSEKLPLAEKDLKSAIELLKHAASTLKILSLGSIEEQYGYVSTWLQIVSTCTQELKHGSLIWKRSLEKNIHTQILTNPQGRQYIHALGEIYRVIEIIGISAKLFKPWILFSSANSTGIFDLLRECSMLWSNTGLQDACQSMSDLAHSDSEAIKALLGSIMYIHNLDMNKLHNHIISGKEPTCHLSLLTAGTVPGMKMVAWNGEHYFLTMANLWANLLSCDPPNLPHILASQSAPTGIM
ncbi:hypothetical protein SLEP1_g20541 [Rubroshorea leprosula]|uniref:Synergin gamma C-terminal domain-containing protein n=1 Tax=Rubroshorea leprosula TaxID=152421 RepID=A0AAV5J325_9ROSI|nr:hypothetical protein SLEP1_g20541 [Rubroshorea leprosula]